MGNYITNCIECLSLEQKLPNQYRQLLNFNLKNSQQSTGDTVELDDSQKSVIFTNVEDKTQKRMTLQDIHIKKELGKGAFGRVVLVGFKQKGEEALYAMKIIDKKKLKNKKLAEGVILEKCILKNNKSPFITKLYYAFQTKSKLYLILEYVQGGDMQKFLNKVKKFPEKVVKFYLGEIILALEYLHTNMKIIYRDLKPENILITETGHVKISDFGLSRAMNENCKTFAGTAEYTAPEIIQRQPYSKVIDFWSLGVLMYELLVGRTPFFIENGNVYQVHECILKKGLSFENVRISKEAKSLITELLNQDPLKRLGKKGIDEIKNHQFFKDLNWRKLSKMEIVPPIKFFRLDEFKKSYKVVETRYEEDFPSFQGFSHVDNSKSNENSLVFNQDLKYYQ